MKIIGVTGGVGSGKSEVLQYMAKTYRCRILMADEVSHEVICAPKEGDLYETSSVYHELVSLLETVPGDPILREDKEIDRKEMAARIFRNPGLRQQVNDLIHPAVRQVILREIETEKKKEEKKDKDAVSFFVLEAALLIECGYQSIVDEMWYIYCDPRVRRNRLKAGRGYTDARIDDIMSSQLSDEAFRNGSDLVIDNSGRLEETWKQVDQALNKR